MICGISKKQQVSLDPAKTQGPKPIDTHLLLQPHCEEKSLGIF